MEDYPINLMEFDARFHSEQACREYLAKIRWPEGFRCPQCNNPQAWITARQLYHCTACGHETSLTAGTVFQDTRKPLMMWFRAMWFVTSQKNGASAVGLQAALGLGSYQTAWTWLHKLRRVMVRPGRDRLRGNIELDETYIGGPEEGLRGRKIENKSLVLVAVEREGKCWARTRMRVVNDFCSETILDFVRDTIEPGSVIRTDGLNCYLTLTLAGYVHDRVVQRTSKESACELLPGVHRVASLLKRWLLGTHQGAVSPQHLGYYLDEFTFRFNRRMSHHRGKLFYRLMQQAVTMETTPYHEIVTKNKKSHI
jgi:transposase-like protein/ribosomal protein L37AE/L43A